MAALVSFMMLDPVPGVAGGQAARGTHMHAQGVLCTKSVGKSRAEGEETINMHCTQTGRKLPSVLFLGLPRV